ncbi:AzlD domain-containing protein [Pseudaestuariivita atlantica]|uniref:Membrane protein n=1 Tax=Pseudaestuariivita atlantica TaxID=1317121 RepID=A0A0L1JT10_9RHOB|nr:AzlD domain-containing protein [Pseudaestuariivita atlantica]KNG94896.1 membrane protein [Pseudaestuariivita atlantica]
MSDAVIWTVILALGIGTYAIRFSFLGFLGDRTLPDWVLRHLRYVGVAVLPALVAPMILWTNGPGSAVDPARLVAAAAGFAAGWRFGVVPALVAGMGTLYAVQALIG